MVVGGDDADIGHAGEGLASNVSRLKDSTTWGLVNSADSDHPRLNKGRK